MKAILLVGGMGTRLRPLTLSTPKALIPFMNVTILETMIKEAAKVGITDVILAVSYKLKHFELRKEMLEKNTGCRIQICAEKTLLGTGGAVKNVEQLLECSDTDFLVANADIICDRYPFRELVDEHVRSGNEVTVLSVETKTPQRYGVLEVEEGTNKILSFIEKPSVPVSRCINGGVYMFKRTVLQNMPRNTRFMLETSVFPLLCKMRKIGVCRFRGGWFDVGTVEDYKKATISCMKRNGLKHKKNIGEETVVSGVKRWKYSVAGKRCRISASTFVRSVVFDGVRISRNAEVVNSIVGNGCRIGRYAVVKNCVLGDGMFVPAFSYLEDEKMTFAREKPDVDVSDSVDIVETVDVGVPTEICGK